MFSPPAPKTNDPISTILPILQSKEPIPKKYSSKERKYITQLEKAAHPIIETIAGWRNSLRHLVGSRPCFADLNSYFFINTECITVDKALIPARPLHQTKSNHITVLAKKITFTIQKGSDLFTVEFCVFLTKRKKTNKVFITLQGVTPLTQTELETYLNQIHKDFLGKYL